MTHAPLSSVSMRALLLLHFLVSSYSFSLVTVENDKLSLTFNESNSALCRFLDEGSGVDMVSAEDVEAAALVPLWTVQLVDHEGSRSISSSSRAISEYSLRPTSKGQTLILSWVNIEVIAPSQHQELTPHPHGGSAVDVTLIIDVPKESSLINWSLEVTNNVNSEVPIGIWEAVIAIPTSAGSSSDGELFFPSGYGESYSNPGINTGGSVSGLYPSSGVAMQFMAVVNTGDVDSTSGVYIGTHDRSGRIKGFEYSTLAYFMSDASPPRQSTHREKRSRLEKELPEVEKRNQSMARNFLKESATLSILQITMYAEDAGSEIPRGVTWRGPVQVTVGIIAGISATAGRPLWSEAASIYRDWATHEAPWTLTTLSERGNLPPWFRSNAMWLNTHWQCHDIFNVTGGEPAVVKDMVSDVASLFNLSSIALHWYEWQQGPDPAPSKRYKFDTHYPDYFPPRQPDLFREVIKSLREDFKVFTFPYINGRIFDINSDTYLSENGAQYCSQYVIEPKLLSTHSANIDNIAPYRETYGSNATFCVSSPFTSYWQGKITETTSELTNGWQVDGVYIDQIGAADPKPCYDPLHGHTLGGGTYWTDGYKQMLSGIHEAVKPRSNGYQPPIVTENNAEVYMDGLQGYLTLVALKMSLAQLPAKSPSHYRRLSPAFPFVYGGYYVGFGAEWFKTDFSDPDWFCGKLSAMFMTGTQMGWFSLISIVDDPSDSCGDMGVGSSLLDPANSGVVEFLRLLATERIKTTSFFVDGHLLRPVVMHPIPPTYTQTTPSKNMPYLHYDSVSTSAWQLPENDNHLRTLVALTGNCLNYTYSGEIIVNFSNWGYDDDATLSVRILSDSASSQRLSERQTYLEGPVAYLSVIVNPRSIVMFELVNI